MAGGGAAGLNAALELADRGLKPVLISRNNQHTYTNALHRLVNDKTDLDDVSIDLEEFLEDTPVKFVKEEIEDFRPEEKEVKTGEDTYSYRNLVLALGNEVKNPVPGMENAENFYSRENSVEAVEGLEEAEKVAVVGAGRKGVQIAGELHENDYELSLIENSTRPLPKESSKASKKVLQLFNVIDLSFRGATTVKEVTSYGVILEESGEVDFDSVIYCGGLSAPKIVQENFSCGEEGVEVNRGLSATDFDGVYAAGGCADIDSGSFSEAVKQGRHAAKNIASSSELLDEYEEGGRKVFSAGSYGIYIRNNSVFINRLIGSLERFQAKKYFVGLKKRKFFL